MADSELARCNTSCEALVNSGLIWIFSDKMKYQLDCVCLQKALSSSSNLFLDP